VFFTIIGGRFIEMICKVNIAPFWSLFNLTNTLLSIGQVLKISSNVSSAPNTYTVKKGDSLYKIAQQNNTTVNELMSLNNLGTTLLSIGQVLKLN
jgi:LysM repeat protein